MHMYRTLLATLIFLVVMAILWSAVTILGISSPAS